MSLKCICSIDILHKNHRTRRHPYFQIIGRWDKHSTSLVRFLISYMEKKKSQTVLAGWMMTSQNRINFCCAAELTDDGMANIGWGVAVSNMAIKHSNKGQGQHWDSWTTFVKIILQLCSCWNHVLWYAKLACKLKAKGLKHSALQNSLMVFSKWKWPPKE